MEGRMEKRREGEWREDQGLGELGLWASGTLGSPWLSCLSSRCYGYECTDCSGIPCPLPGSRRCLRKACGLGPSMGSGTAGVQWSKLRAETGPAAGVV